jgi:hypothetical protein|tara:strand:+ start:95 stop:637 length:543 start_codon:yes stop_codon:yes gene_type:complete
MFVDVKKRTQYSVLADASHELKGAFSQIRDEFEDHLISINENTNEIQSTHQYLAEVDSKIEKIGQRIDQLQMFLQQSHGFKAEEKPQFSIKPLAKKEQEIFLMLYTLEEKGAVNYADIARLTALTDDLVSSYVTSMIEKGIPIVKKYIHGRAYLTLNQEFKQLQAKENILRIEQRTFSNF